MSKTPQDPTDLDENQAEVAQTEGAQTEIAQSEIAKRALALKKANPPEPHPETTPTDHGEPPRGDQNLDADQQRSNTIDAHTESLSRSGGVRHSDQG